MFSSRQLLLLFALLLLVILDGIQAAGGLPDKGTKDTPLPVDNPLDYARRKGVAGAGTSKSAPGKTKPVAGKPKPAAAVAGTAAKGATPGKKAPSGKVKPAPLSESDYLTNVNSISEEDPKGKKVNKPAPAPAPATATATAVPTVHTTVAPSIGRSFMDFLY